MSGAFLHALLVVENPYMRSTSLKTGFLTSGKYRGRFPK